MFTVTTTTRNDGYGGNLLGRIQAWVDGLDEYASRYDWDLEILLVEWNPPDDRPMLEEAVRRPLTASFRIIRVPKVLHNTFDNADRLVIHGHLGRNVALRRARGDWILSTTQDVLFSDRLARFLALGNLDRQYYYRVTRFDSNYREVPDGGVAEQVAYLASDIEKVRTFLPLQHMFTRACGDFLLIHKSGWHKIRGTPEWSVHDVYLDGITLFAAHTSGLYQIALDPTRAIYHIKHGGGAVKLATGGLPSLHYESTYKYITQGMIRKGEPIQVNDENWGLMDCEERKVGNVTWELDGDVDKQRGFPVPPPCWI